MLAGLLMVLGLMARLQQPETHRAIGRAFGEPIPVAAAPASNREPLVAGDAFADVRDNAPFRDDEQNAWFETLAAVKRSEPAELAAHSVGAVGYAALTSQPDTYRGVVVGVAGKARRVERVEPAANELAIDALWRVTIEPTGGEVWPITVYTLDEPPSADEPYETSAVGVFFKKLSYRWAEGVGSTPVIVAQRLETTLSPQPVAGATPAANPQRQADADFSKPTAGSMGRALLADLGYDEGLFETIVDRRSLSAEESDAFYALLAAVEQTPATQLVRLSRAGLDNYVARRTDHVGETLRDRQTARALKKEQERGRYSVLPLFGDGVDERGELVTIDAVVRRVVWIDASGSDSAAERGVEGYYELEAFPEDSQNLPVVFVVRDLPAGFPVGDSIRQPARLAGFFFKQWAYRTRQRSDQNAANDRRQFAPLLVGRAPIPLATPDPSASRPGRMVGLVATIGLIGVVLAIWRLGRRDRRYEAATLARFRGGGDGEPRDFDRLGELADQGSR